MFHYSSGNDFPSFRIFPIACKRAEIVCRATFNASASCFCVWQSSSFKILANQRLQKVVAFLSVLCHPRQNHHIWSVEIILCMMLPLKHVRHKLPQKFYELQPHSSLKNSNEVKLPANAAFLAQNSTFLMEKIDNVCCCMKLECLRTEYWWQMSNLSDVVSFCHLCF